MTIATPPKLRLLRFISDACAICRSQEKLQVVERFVEDKQIAVVPLMCADKDGRSPKGTDYEAAYKLSDSYGIRAFPTLVLEAKLDGGSSVEVFRAEGGVNVRELEKIYKESVAEIFQKEAPSWE